MFTIFINSLFTTFSTIRHKVNYTAAIFKSRKEFIAIQKYFCSRRKQFSRNYVIVFLPITQYLFINKNCF